MVHVTSLQRMRGDEAKDERVDTTGCIGLCYPYFIMFNVLGSKGVLVF
jgi:hypothetical protein